MRLYLLGVAALVCLYVFGQNQPLVQLLGALLLTIVAIPAWKLGRKNERMSALTDALQQLEADEVPESPSDGARQ